MDDGTPFTGPDDDADAGLRPAPDEVWDRVRADYLAGWSAPACSRRHGVGLSTLRKRARAEEWRRTDQPWAAPKGLERDDEGLALEERFDGDLERIPLGELSVVAFQRMMRAVLHGNAAEALRWRRVRQALDAEDAHLRRLYERAQAAQRRAEQRALNALMTDMRDETRAMEAELRRRDAAAPIDGIDGIDGVFASSPASPPPPAVLPGLPVGKAPTGPP